MRCKLVVYTFFSFMVAVAGHAHAQEFEFRSTDHFGVLKLKVEDRFHLATMCTVSGGSSALRVQQISALSGVIPFVGDVLADAMQATPLKKGEALCGLRHYKGPSAWTGAADTEGFKLDIRTYADEVLVGGGSPTAACRKFFVNWSSLCFEEITLKDNNDTVANGVTACIETKRPGDDAIISIVNYAGVVKDSLKAEVANESTALQMKPCADRNY